MGLELQYKYGQTPIDEEELAGLKISSVTLQRELNQLEQANIEKAILWLRSKKLKKEDILSHKFIQTIHKRMFDDVWKWAGEFRKSDKNIGVQWSQASIELKKLLDDTEFWIDHESYHPHEIAIRFKHRLVSIHCFPNGNGRHSRLMADIIISKIFNEPEFSWHQDSALAPEEIRANYISALKEADKGNIGLLLQFAKD